MDAPQVFWDAYRKRLRLGFSCWGAYEKRLRELPRYLKKKDVSSQISTKLRTEAAILACHDFADLAKREVCVGEQFPVKPFRDQYYVDVYAKDAGTGKFIAFETELADWGYNGSSGKDWREEFSKLCHIKAELRILSSCYKAGTAWRFPADLRGWLDSLGSDYTTREPGSFCLNFGPSATINDPDQAWVAYSLEPDFTLRGLSSAKPLRPRPLINGSESPEE